MGGIGSGRRWHFSAKDTASGYHSIDIRWLKRQGLLSPGMSRQITWYRRGEVTGSINIRSEAERLILDYRQRDRGGEWRDENYPIHLETTPCHLGGERHWFLCPARGCGRRVAILYGGAIFACRHCYRLAYPSQREHFTDRAARRADRIRDKLGWKPGILNGPGWQKPKGMHWKTFERLCEEHHVHEQTALAGIVQRFDLRL